MVLPENAPAVRLFLTVQTQWIYAGQWAIPAALDYRSVEAAMNMEGIEAERRRDLFAALRVIEAAALSALQDDWRRILNRR